MSVSLRIDVDLALKLHETKDGIYEPPLKLTVEVESRDGKLGKDGTFIDPEDFLDTVSEALEPLQNKYIGDVKGLAYIPHTLEMIISRIYERIQDDLPYNIEVTELTLRKDDVFVVKYNVRNPKHDRQPQPLPQPKLKAKARK